MKEIKKGLLMVLFTLLLALMACSSGTSTDDAADEAEEKTDEATAGESGGTLNIAIDAPPPTLDQPSSTAVAARDASRLIFEGLVATDSMYNPVPMLAETIETDDNKTYVFHLREGIKFHNGEEMTSEDVVASMERWLELSTITGNVFNDAKWVAEDEYTVVLELAEASSLTLDTMASAKQAAGIMPKEIVESAPAEGIEEYIGTGPFKFVEWKTDQYIHYTKYEDYQAVDMEADGLSGKKEALVDDIYIHMVPDTSTRVAGLQTGEYDFAYGIPYDNFEQIDSDDNLDTILTPSANMFLGLNKVEGIASDVKMREVINMALDNEEIMMASFPNPDFFWLDSGYMDVGIENWASTAGSEYYNQNDPEKAKELLEEMGYDNEEFRIMVTRDYDHHYNAGVVIHEKLKSIGLNAELEVYDWPTLLDLRDSDTSAWDAFMTTSSIVSTPPQLLALSPTWAGGVNDDSVVEAMKEIEFAPSLEEAQALWDDLQLYAWEELIAVAQIGGYNDLFGYNKKVEGITTNTGPIFWNVTVSE